MPRANGIDVSHWQHPGNRPIDWLAVREYGIGWVAVKLTEGTSFVDPWAERDIAGAKAAGLHVVAYHFAQPMRSGPEMQADHFLRTLWTMGGVDEAAVDVEVGVGMGWPRLGAWVAGYLKADAAQLVYWPDAYARQLRRYVYGIPFREWVARWGDRPPSPMPSVWQFAVGRLPGIAAWVDLNVVLNHA